MYLTKNQYYKLLLLALGLFWVKLTFIQPFSPFTLNLVGTAYLVTGISCLAAAGCLIRNLLNEKNAKHNLNRQKKGYYLFLILNIAGVIPGFYLSNLIGRPGFFVFFILASSLLYFAEKSWRKWPLITPLTHSFLLASAFLSLWIFDTFPALNPQNKNLVSFIFNILFAYALFAGILHFISALIRDQTTVDEDYNKGCRSLSTTLGKARSNKIIFALLLLPVLLIIYYASTYLYLNLISLTYAFIFILIPLLYCLYKIYDAHSQKDYRQLLIVMNIILICSILAIGLFQLQFILKS